MLYELTNFLRRYETDKFHHLAYAGLAAATVKAGFEGMLRDAASSVTTKALQGYYYRVGVFVKELAHYSVALGFMETALALAAFVYGNHSLEFLDALLCRGNIKASLKHYVDAQADSVYGHELLKAHHPDNTLYLGIICNNIGNNALVARQISEAERLFALAISVYRATPCKDLTSPFGSMATVLLLQEKPVEEIDAMSKEYFDLVQKHHPEGTRQYILAHLNRALDLYGINRDAEALELAFSGKSQAQMYFGGGHELTGLACKYLGDFLAAGAKYKEAQEQYLEAMRTLDQFKESNEANLAGLVKSLSNLAFDIDD